jgi:NAD(P)-dependent dehydrogenase (short-subunit alcohol dehydrogenase family)
MEELAGRVAVVTGGAGGVGRALGERFAAEGMRVVLADVFAEPLEEAVAAVRDRGAEAIGVVTDVSDLASVEHLADAAYDAFGAVHVLCNNAGVGAGAEGHIWDHTPNDWGWGLAVNLWGVIHGIKAFVPRMLEAGEEGHVVNTSSGNGGIAPLTSTAIYATTKAAVTTVTEVLYGQLRAVGSPIGASVLFPGPKVLRPACWSRPASARAVGSTTRPAGRRTPPSSRSRPGCGPPGSSPTTRRWRPWPRRPWRHPGGPVLDPARQRAHRPHHPRPGRVDAGRSAPTYLEDLR